MFKTVQPQDDTAEIEQMISEGTPDPLRSPTREPRPRVPCAQCGGATSAAGRCRRCGHRTGLAIVVEPSAEIRAAERRAARRIFRVYCVACGRSTESLAPPARPGRCPACDGTLLVEYAGD